MGGGGGGWGWGRRGWRVDRSSCPGPCSLALAPSLCPPLGANSARCAGFLGLSLVLSFALPPCGAGIGPLRGLSCSFSRALFRFAPLWGRNRPAARAFLLFLWCSLSLCPSVGAESARCAGFLAHSLVLSFALPPCGGGIGPLRGLPCGRPGRHRHHRFEGWALPPRPPAPARGSRPEGAGPPHEKKASAVPAVSGPAGGGGPPHDWHDRVGGGLRLLLAPGLGRNGRRRPTWPITTHFLSKAHAWMSTTSFNCSFFVLCGRCLAPRLLGRVGLLSGGRAAAAAEASHCEGALAS